MSIWYVTSTRYLENILELQVCSSSVVYKWSYKVIRHITFGYLHLLIWALVTPSQSVIPHPRHFHPITCHYSSLCPLIHGSTVSSVTTLWFYHNYFIFLTAFNPCSSPIHTPVSALLRQHEAPTSDPPIRDSWSAHFHPEWHNHPILHWWSSQDRSLY